MKVNESLSMQVMLEKRKTAKNGRCSVFILLVVAGRNRRSYLRIKIQPELFDEGIGKASGCFSKAIVINVGITKSKKNLKKHGEILAKHHGHAGELTTGNYLIGLPFKSGNHES